MFDCRFNCRAKSKYYKIWCLLPAFLIPFFFFFSLGCTIFSFFTRCSCSFDIWNHFYTLIREETYTFYFLILLTSMRFCALRWIGYQTILIDLIRFFENMYSRQFFNSMEQPICKTAFYQWLPKVSMPFYRCQNTVCLFT